MFGVKGVEFQGVQKRSCFLVLFLMQCVFVFAEMLQCLSFQLVPTCVLFVSTLICYLERKRFWE